MRYVLNKQNKTCEDSKSADVNVMCSVYFSLHPINLEKEI